MNFSLMASRSGLLARRNISGDDASSRRKCPARGSSKAESMPRVTRFGLVFENSVTPL